MFHNNNQQVIARSGEYIRPPERRRTITQSNFRSTSVDCSITERGKGERERERSEEDKLDRFVNTAGWGWDVSRHVETQASWIDPGSNIVPNANRSLHRVSVETTLSYSLMQPRERQPASRCQGASITSSWKLAERLRGRPSRSNSALMDPFPRYLDSSRRIRILFASW